MTGVDECGASCGPVKHGDFEPPFHALCTLPEGHKYDHYDEAMNWQWENKQ